MTAAHKATTNERLLEVVLDLAECLEIETSSKRDDGSTYTRIDATPIRELAERYRDLCAHYYKPKPIPGGEKSTAELAGDAKTATHGFDRGRPLDVVALLADRATALQERVDLHRPELAEIDFARFLVSLATDLLLGAETFAHARGRLVARVEAESNDDASVFVIVARPNKVGWAGRLWAHLVEGSTARARRATAVGENREQLVRALLLLHAAEPEPVAYDPRCRVCGRLPATELHAPGCIVAASGG